MEITQYFGQNGHIGVDWGCARGTPIYAVAPGTVTEIKNTHHLGYHPYVSDDLKDYNGNFVRVTTNMDGIDFQHVYLHLQPGSVVVKKGERGEALSACWAWPATRATPRMPIWI